jgi:micrococcal nuclease
MNDQKWRVPCRFPRTIDGDTVEVELDLGWKVSMREIIRLYGIDCPETHGARASGAGIVAANFTRDWLGVAKTLEVESLKFDGKKDAYGRTLARIYRDDDPVSLNQALLDSGNAVPFMV